MRLLVNTASTFKGGGVQVAASFLQECRKFEDHEFGVVLGPGLFSVVKPTDFPENFTFRSIRYRPAQRVLSLRRQGSELDEFERQFDPDTVFTTSGPSYWRPNAPHLMGFNLPHYLYPDSPYFDKVLGPLQRLRWRLKGQFIYYYTRGFADAWVVQTDDVNQRLRRWIGSEDVFTVSNTISEAYRDARSDEGEGWSRQAEVDKDFRLLVLSSYYMHKNIEILNDIIRIMRGRGISGLRFTVTLPAADYERAIAPENRGWVDNAGPQSLEDCPKLYQKADALFLPSLLECFSANYVEAMAMRRPIITTQLGFARTICGDAALYFRPLDADAALQQMLRLRTDEGLRNDLTRRGLLELQRFGTAQERAQKYLDICQELIDVGGKRK